MHSELLNLRRSHSELEEKNIQLSSELKITKQDYESKISSLNADLMKSRQIENDLKVFFLIFLIYFKEYAISITGNSRKSQ